ncbi:MAG: universal stress protein [Calditrichaeota bacterium]|nr:universal stress protein [Calditrichota bacterium]
MIKSILLAVDGSAHTEFVLKYGIDFARRCQAHLRVLTVVDIRFFEWAVAIGVEGFAPIIPSSTYQEESQRLLNEKADKLLERAGQILQDAGQKFDLMKENGSPVEVICEKSRLCDMIIMGARGEFERWSDKMLGATLEAVTRLSIKPVFVVRKAYRPIKKILLAYDGSMNSNRALPWAGYIGECFQAPLTIVNVNDSREDAETILKEAHDYLLSYKLPNLETVRKEGDQPDRIVETCKEVEADMIIMGSYGHSRIREAILGSTTVQVMRKSPVPILMVK